MRAEQHLRDQLARLALPSRKCMTSIGIYPEVSVVPRWRGASQPSRSYHIDELTNNLDISSRWIGWVQVLEEYRRAYRGEP